MREELELLKELRLKQDLNQLKEKKPDIFKYKNKVYKMIYYSLEATHESTKQISDLIVWEDRKGHTIEYDKGQIKEVL